MIKILETKLRVTIKYLEQANYHHDILNAYYYEGQKVLLENLISEYNEMLYSAQQDAYDDGYYLSDIDRHMLEKRDLIKEQVENAHNTLYFTRGIGKSVINLDSYWFTSDEIEAFRIIWQRRISAM